MFLMHNKEPMKNRIALYLLITMSLLLPIGTALTASAQSCPSSPGCLDPTFGTGGKVTYQFSGVPLDMVAQTDGKLVELLSENKLIRLNPDGTLDSTFGSGGVVTIVWTLTSGSTTYNGG